MNRAEALKQAYALLPHPEGGSFSEVYTAPFARADGRSLCGSIYFLLEGEEISHLHRIDCDEIWYYHEGCGLQLTVIAPDGAVSRQALGPDVEAGQRAMLAVPAGAAFASENIDKAGYSFVSCATAPRFTYEGFRLLSAKELRSLCPDRADALSYLCLKSE